MALISVIVPVYKVEPYIRRCVDSILGQTFRDFQLILVDDGSPDSCGSICDAYAEKDSRIHVIHQKNGGLSAARNAGLDWMFANSRSSWVTFVDSDDWIHPEMLERLLRAAVEQACSISVCYAFVTEGADFPEQPGAEAMCISADEYYCTSKAGGTGPTAWGKLYTSDLFEEIRYPVGKLHEDEFVTYRTVYAAEKIAVVPCGLYAYYQNPAGIMRAHWNVRRMDGVEALEAQITFAEDTGNKVLHTHVFQVYTWYILEQLKVLRQMPAPTPEQEACRASLRAKLRDALGKAPNKGRYPPTVGNLWVYEEAWPENPVWKLLHGIARGLHRFRKQ